MGVTLQQIADHLQISKATVSRSLRNDPLILPRTRATVHATALEMGYEGRPRAANKAKDGNFKSPSSAQPTIGLLFPGTSLDQARQDFNFMQIMQGIMAETERAGTLLMVHTMRAGERDVIEEHAEQIPPMVRQKACQALIIWGAFHPTAVACLIEHMPVVSIGRTYSELPVDAVVADNVEGVSRVVTHLVQQGHQRLAWIGGHYVATFLHERHAGFIHGCLRNGLDLSQQRFLEQEIYEDRFICAPEKVLKTVQEGATALVCGNDAIARQVIELLENRGLRVPQDVSVTGFDAQRPAPEARQITSLDPHFTELGRAAVRLVAQRLTQSPAPPTKVSVRSTFVLGETTETTSEKS